MIALNIKDLDENEQKENVFHNRWGFYNIFNTKINLFGPSEIQL